MEENSAGGKIYIIGAGMAGTMLAAEITRKGIFGSIAAFLDDDPEKIATAYGLKYLRIESGYDASALKNALEDESPWIIDVRLNPKSKLLNRYDDPAIITEAAE